MVRLFAALFAMAMLALGYALWWGERADSKAERALEQVAQITAERDGLASALAAERDKVAKYDAIGTKHEEDRAHAETVPAAVAADLRAGNIRLRREWQGCETQRLSDATAAAIERDALAASRDEAAGRIVRIGRDADDQLRACQAVILADRS